MVHPHRQAAPGHPDRAAHRLCKTPRLSFLPQGNRHPEPNQFVVRLDPTTGTRLILDAHRADQAGPEAITLDVEFAQQGGEAPAPYEVLLLDALRGNSTRFTRQDGVEETWRIFARLIDHPTPIHPYAPGSWGPAAANELLAGFGKWHGPWSRRRWTPTT